MFNSKLRLSRSSLIVIIICLVVLFTIFILSYFNLRHISTLQTTVDDLSKEDSGIVLLRKCNTELMMAEDHYRIYINSADSTKKDIFLSDINDAIADCDKLSSFDASFSEKIQRDVNFKLLIYDVIKKLRSLSDSIANKPGHTFTIITLNNPVHLEQMNKSFFKNYFSSSTDTLKLVQDKKKLGFFQKLGYLFSNKSITDTKKEFVKGSSSEKRYIDSVQHETDSTINGLSAMVRNYYQRSVNRKLTVQQKIREKETILAESNLSTLQAIESKINELIAIREKADDARTADIFVKADKARAAIQKITFFSLLSIFLLIVLLIYNIYRTNRYEEAILEAKISAEKLARLKSRFLSNMSHEIRSPLTAIMGFTEQMVNQEKNTYNGKYLDAIKVSSNHLLNTVNDILDFSKLDAGKLVLNKQPFILKNAIDEVALALSLEAEKKGIGLNTNILFDDGLNVNGDVYRFKQILFNLLSNAIKFTDKGNVDIIASSDKKSEKNIIATVSVKDSGIGIRPSELHIIFQEFAQAANYSDKEHARAVKGTGLGLPITKMLAELQNGSITVQSVPGKGSIFTVKIPYEIVSTDKFTPQAVLKPLELLHSHEKSGVRVLLAEDNELNIMLISILLERMGYSFDVATDGEKAMQLHQENNYHLILTDINIPKLTGIQLAEKIRKGDDPVKSSIKIIALTAAVINEDFNLYYTAGINKILVKPFKEEEFRLSVEKYLAEPEIISSR
ncbi:MAG TPA: ATP-binding protein [Puia sp.]|nr:ATP-binding protein [Puia sp.]